MPTWGLTSEQMKLQPWGIPEEYLAPNKTITDPVHGDIYLTKLERLLVDIVGNTICADLSDYIRRDHHNTGLPLALGHRFMDSFFVTSAHHAEFPKRMVIRIERDGRTRNDVVTEIVKFLRYRYELTERVLTHHAKTTARRCSPVDSALTTLRVTVTLSRIGLRRLLMVRRGALIAFCCFWLASLATALTPAPALAFSCSGGNYDSTSAQYNPSARVTAVRAGILFRKDGAVCSDGIVMGRAIHVLSTVNSTDRSVSGPAHAMARDLRTLMTLGRSGDVTRISHTLKSYLAESARLTRAVAREAC